MRAPLALREAAAGYHDGALGTARLLNANEIAKLAVRES